jgi:protein-tyrosine phosphatase
MAAALGERELKQRGRAALVISAGTLNLRGHRADPHAEAVCEEIGLDLSGHRSQGINNPLIGHADYLVVMAPRHERELLKLYPRLGDRIVRLWEHDPEDEGLDQIDDPIGQGIEAFRGCRERLERCISAWAQTLD